MTHKLKQILGEDTLLPISFVLVIVGAVYFVAEISSKADSASKMAFMAQTSLVSIDQRLSRIEGKLGIMGVPTK